MGVINLVCWALGVVLIVVGYQRARGPWARYQELKAQEANLARYETWRGKRVRDEGPSAASIMAQELRRRAQIGGSIVAVGFVLLVVGFAVH
jgi:hypothetical protein